jgi:hypothetical protein
MPLALQVTGLHAQCDESSLVPVIKNAGPSGRLCATSTGTLSVEFELNSSLEPASVEYSFDGTTWRSASPVPIAVDPRYRANLVINNRIVKGTLRLRARYSATCSSGVASIDYVVNDLGLATAFDPKVWCPYTTQAEIKLTVSNGLAPFRVSYGIGANPNFGSSTPLSHPPVTDKRIFTDPSITHNYSVEDHNGCRVEVRGIVIPVAKYSLTARPIKHPSCDPSINDGEVCVDLNQDRSCPPLSIFANLEYRWTGPGIEGYRTGNCIDGLGHGRFTVSAHNQATGQLIELLDGKGDTYTLEASVLLERPRRPLIYPAISSADACVNGLGSISVFISPGNFQDYGYELFDAAGHSLRVVPRGNPPQELPAFFDLNAGTYRICADNGICPVCTSVVVKDRNPCDPPLPSRFEVRQGSSSTEVLLKWPQARPNLPFAVRYRKSGDSQWMISDNFFGTGDQLISGLDPCSNYEFQVGIRCCTSVENPKYLSADESSNLKLFTTTLALSWPGVVSPVKVCTGSRATLQVDRQVPNVELRWYQGTTLLQTDAAGSPPSPSWGQYQTAELSQSTLFRLEAHAGECSREQAIEVQVIPQLPLPSISGKPLHVCRDQAVNLSLVTSQSGVPPTTGPHPGPVLYWEYSFDGFLTTTTVSYTHLTLPTKA